MSNALVGFAVGLLVMIFIEVGSSHGELKKTNALLRECLTYLDSIDGKIGEVGCDGIGLLKQFRRSGHPGMIHERQCDVAGAKRVDQARIYPRFISYFEREVVSRG